jgi:hypothetical protein
MSGELGGTGDDLVGSVLSGIGAGVKIGFKLFTDTISIKKKKNFFAIKNTILYWYGKENSREAKNNIPIKEMKTVEINSKNPKEFYIFYKKKCYRFEGTSEFIALKWVNSLKLV